MRGLGLRPDLLGRVAALLGRGTVLLLRRVALCGPRVRVDRVVRAGGRRRVQVRGPGLRPHLLGRVATLLGRGAVLLLRRVALCGPHVRVGGQNRRPGVDVV